MTVVDLLLSDEFLPKEELVDWLKTGKDANVKNPASSSSTVPPPKAAISLQELIEVAGSRRKNAKKMSDGRLGPHTTWSNAPDDSEIDDAQSIFTTPGRPLHHNVPMFNSFNQN